MSLVLLVEETPFIADDLAEVVGAVLPEHTLIAAQNAEEALAVLERRGGEPAVIAVAHLSSKDKVVENLLARLRGDDASVVVINGDPARVAELFPPERVRFVSQPYRSAVIEEAIGTLIALRARDDEPPPRVPPFA